MVASSNPDTLNCKKGISIIIPAYNEKDRIKYTMDKYIPVIESFNLPYEIIVVIDGQDGTENVIKNYKNLKYYKSASRYPTYSNWAIDNPFLTAPPFPNLYADL